MTCEEFGKLKLGDYIVCVSTTMYGDNNFGAKHKDLSYGTKYKVESIDNKNQKIRIIDDANMEWGYAYQNFEDSILFCRKKKLLKLNENKSKYN